MKRSPANVGVLGYYGYGNLGDDMILSSIKAALAPHTIFPIQTGFQASRAAIARLNHYDYLVLGGGGLFTGGPPAPFDTFDQWAELLQAPIVGLGLGVNSLDPAYRDATRILIDRSRLFVVRDQASQDLLEHPRVAVSPDLTFYHPVKVTPGQCSDSPVGVNLRPTHPEVTNWAKAISSLPAKLRGLPFSVRATFDDRIAIRSVVADCPDAPDPRQYTGIRAMIGMALHSVILAVQSGIPCLAISYSPKVARFMQDVGLSDYLLRLDQVAELQPTFFKMLANAPVVASNCVAYTKAAGESLTELLAELRRDISAASYATASAPTSKRPPRITTFVIDGHATDENTQRTLRSCEDQSFVTTEIHVLSDECEPSPHSQESDQEHLPVSRHNATSRAGGQLRCAVAACSAEYVSVVSPGCTLAHDALSVLVDALEREPTVDAAYSDYFLKDNGVLEQARTAHCPPKDPASPHESHFYVTRRAVLVHALGNPRPRLSFWPRRRPRVLHHVEMCLYSLQSSHLDSLVLRGAVAYAARDPQRGKALLSEALGTEHRQDSCRLERVFDTLLRPWYLPFYGVDIREYWESLMDHFPTQTHAQRRARRLFAARAFLELAYMHAQEGNHRLAVSSLARAFASDPGLARSWGHLKLLLSGVASGLSSTLEPRRA